MGVGSGQVTVLASNGVKAAMEELGPAFERASGHKLALRFGLGADLKRGIESGEAFDLALLAAAALDDLARQGRVDAASRAPLARSGSGLCIRKGAARPDIGSVDALKRALLSAKSICWAKEGASGAYFAGLVERMGIAAEVKRNATLASSGDEVGRLVAGGKCELGVILVNEIMAAPGVELLGPLPREVQGYTEFRAGIASGSNNAGAAQALIDFLQTPPARAVFRAKGQEPMAEVQHDLAAVVEREREFLAKSGAPAGAAIGLAFSGGGIRSATFNLGMIQALAECRLLSRFHYLSTVSGGGYIGSWLSALIHRSGEGRVERIEAALAATADNLPQRAADCGRTTKELADLAAEASYAIQYLRRYASYLTPRAGVFGLDTLTGVAIYLRNLQLNFSILFLSFIAVLLVPYLAADLAGWVEGSLALAVALAALCAFAVGFGMGEPLEGRQDRLWAWIACAAALAACLVAADWLASPFVPALLDGGPGNWMAVAAFINVVFWVISTLGRGVRSFFRAARWEKDDADELGARGASFFVGAVVAGALVGLAFHGFAQLGTCLTASECRVDSFRQAIAEPRDVFAEAAGIQFLPWVAIGIFAPLLALLASMAVVLQIGIARRGFSEHDREWLGRLGALLLKCCLAWTASAAAVMLAPPLVYWAGAWLYSGGAAWVLTTLAGLFAAKGGKTFALGSAWRDRLLGLVPWVFVAGLLVLLAFSLQLLLSAPFDTSGCKPYAEEAAKSGRFLHYAATSLCETSWTNLDPLPISIARLHVILFLSSLLAAYLLGWRFDINLFAFHQFYRNRLVRCFLGATKYARPNERQALQRHPNEFTDLDPDDDLRLHDLARPLPDGGVQHPLHLVNTALNLANPRELGWQQRKAASFTFSPLFAGYELRYERSRRGGFRDMQLYGAEGGKGMKLGIPLAISGAAASPNQGYHTSAGLAFLMTVFNVRLGRWCGNTVDERAWRLPGPVFSNHYLFKELLADTDERSAFLYLSDGGHFENLGIYELVRRRCAVIVACDAGCDPKFQFEDLGNAILKCETDLGVEITLDVDALRPEEENGPCLAHFVVGTITYPGIPEPGTLIYIKSSMTGDEAVDIQHYKSKHSEFPHETTADQWFDEPQFESYRRLGHHIGMEVFERIKGEANMNADVLRKRFA